MYPFIIHGFSRISLPYLASLPDTTTTYYEPTPTSVSSTSAWTPTETILSSTTTSLQSSTINATPSAAPIESGGGLSGKNKAIIGGVVGGIGGAIILGALVFIFITRWKKSRRASDRESFHPQIDDNNSLHSPEMSAAHNSGEYSFYNSAANLSGDRIMSSQPGRY